MGRLFDKGQGKRATERGKPCGKTAGHSKGAEGALRGAVGHYGGTRRGRWARNGRERETEDIIDESIYNNNVRAIRGITWACYS